MTPSEMTQLQVELRASAEAVFAGLYRIDIAELSPVQRAQHQQQLSAAYGALVKLENARLVELTQTAKAGLVTLNVSLTNLAQQVSQAGKAGAVLTAVGKGMDALESVLKVLG